MADATAIAKLSMLSDLERLTAYSQNVSNAGTIGYKRQIPLNLSFASLLDPAAVPVYGSSGITLSSSDLASGTLQSTGRPLDVAIEGDGFLVVNTSQGLRYTRRGDLHLDSQGRLVNMFGDPLMGTGGDIRLKTEKVEIDRDGQIRAGDELLGRLQMAQFEDPSSLVYEGDGLFSAGATAREDRATLAHLRQGYLEASNVHPLQDTLGLMETSRHLDMVGKALVAYDSMLDAVINNLGSSQ
jgi:flagellar basal body rod protein FlgG